jgi:hypothetical protein
MPICQTTVVVDLVDLLQAYIPEILMNTMTSVLYDKTVCSHGLYIIQQRLAMSQ